ncbi:caspase family protein, partial [Shewanella algae]|uniref:caspase family protein n=2 Tax=Pseudomonadota TaxID=1224 RepID=UPI00313EE744
IAVVYYAGHGLEIGGTNYLIPVDAKLASDRDADDEAIPLERMVSSADGAKRLRLVILDACRDNPFVGTMRRERRSVVTRAVSSGLGKVEP